ncbi:histidine phosphatase family protein [Corynebacterium gerontici]|uniref:Bifunctional RNase H/acid phosphatase n=1 Tax=Corynebacterium gerontici TaxID=2079234 RepID=A0A3G6IXY2_9CORY|nr:histidine phosphatase family protein [Corynebacterium gerontici]AZA10506.1 bifunctional RNase H/acid phosphatase [Corynebacterium gerontici]
MARIILMRHGLTFGNIARKLDTRPPGAELCDEGREGAAAAGFELARLSNTVELGCSSVAIRAQQSLVACANTYEQATARALELRVLQGLHEVDAGDFENSNSEAAHEAYGNAMHAWLGGNKDARMPGGESAEEVIERMMPTLEVLAQQEHDVLVVTHGGVMRILGHYIGGVPAELIAQVPVKNSTSVVLGENFRCEWWVNRAL